MVKSTRYYNLSCNYNVRKYIYIYTYTPKWKCLAECGYSICSGDRKITKNELRIVSPQNYHTTYGVILTSTLLNKRVFTICYLWTSQNCLFIDQYFIIIITNHYTINNVLVDMCTEKNKYDVLREYNFAF